MNVCSAVADWTREEASDWSPARSLLKSIRDYQSAKSVVAKKLAVLRHRLWSIVTGADIPINCKLGGGLLLPHPIGIVIHPEAVLGPNCLLFQQVTIGAAGGGVPRIGGHVDVGAGAKLIGPIQIGDHAVIGANAVVVTDVPPGATAIGIPARIIERTTIEAASDEDAQSAARNFLDDETVAKWSIGREEGTNRVVVCRNLHAIDGPEVVEYLDEIDPAQARRSEAKWLNTTH
jgi:serine O-acetyltransferase